jgi:glyoxylase-like metal-dependent hydrolase (beta-lactamase superfamily II)
MKRKTSRRLIAVTLGTLAAAPALAPAAEYRHFGWDEVAPGVWFGKPLPNFFQGGNVTIVTLPGGGSLVVDTHNSEYLGREILEKAKALGRGPVKYVVNTHLHQDHMGGNAAFLKDNPKVEIMAHRATCEGAPFKTALRMVDRLPGIIKGREELLAKRSGLADGAPEAAGLDHRIQGTELYLQDAKDFKWTMPNVCLDLKPGEGKVIEEAGRRVEIRYFGRGHSAGDLVVFLPKEKVVVVGDLWGQGSGFVHPDAGIDGRDGSVLETPHTLRALSKLDFDQALTGHAGVLRGKASIERAIALGEQTIARIKEANDRGTSIGPLLQKLPPPPADKAPQFVIDNWVSVVVRTFEEIELRRMWGLPLPGEDKPAK